VDDVDVVGGEQVLDRLGDPLGAQCLGGGAGGLRRRADGGDHDSPGAADGPGVDLAHEPHADDAGTDARGHRTSSGDGWPAG
jgi:hypothetical protein